MSLLPLTVAEVVLVYLGVTGRLFGHLLSVETVCLGPYLAGLACLRYAKLPAARTVLFIIGVGIALQAAALTAQPRSSDDVYRYIFDAKVQLHGTDPYRYAPNAQQLTPLRSRPLFYPARTCVWTAEPGTCTEINRPSVHTIYPPVAEAAFTAARLGSGSSTDGPGPLQVLAALTGIAVGVVLGYHCFTNGRPAWTVAVWSWCPVTVFELGNNGHIDGLAVLFSVGGLLATRSRRPGLSGALLAAATLTKLYPALLFAVALKHRPRRVLAAAIGLGVLAYLPHVLAVGTDVIGYLPGYLKEENYGNGGRFMLLSAVLPAALTTWFAVAILLAAALWAFKTSATQAPEQTAVWLTGLSLLVTTPSYSWYALLLLGLVALSGRLEWLPLAIAPTIAMLGAPLVHDPSALRALCYTAGLIWPLLRLLRGRLQPAGAVRTSATPLARD